VEKGVCNLHIPDVFALAAQDPAVAQIIGALLTKLKMIAEAEGKL
jgi:hypothetical protein